MNGNGRRCLALIALLLWVTGAAAESIWLDASDARVRPPIPPRDIAVGYVELGSRTGQDLWITGASSPAARSIEIHNHIMDNGVARMRRLAFLKVAGDEPVVLAPGGLHLMIFGFEPPADGVVPVTLELGNGSRETFEFTVMDFR